MIFWLFLLGRLFTKDVELDVPYENIAIGLVAIAVPCIFGVLIRKFFPKASDLLSNLLKPLSGIFILWVFIVGSITNFYVYQVMITVWYVVPAGMALPICGMVMGCTVAKVFRQPPSKVIAISIETGVQDTGIAILLLLASFPKPEGSIAVTIPVTTSIFTAFPLIVAVAIRCFHLKYNKPGEKDKEANNQRQLCLEKAQNDLTVEVQTELETPA